MFRTFPALIAFLVLMPVSYDAYAGNFFSKPGFSNSVSYVDQVAQFYETNKRPLTYKERAEFAELVKNKAFPFDQLDSKFGSSVAILAARAKDIETIRLLLGKININLQNQRGETVLSWAAKTRIFRCIALAKEGAHWEKIKFLRFNAGGLVSDLGI